MSLQTWQETLVTAQVDGSTLASSSSATSIIPAAAKYTLPPNFFAIGKVLRIKLIGRLSNIVTTPGTLTLDVRFGTGPIVVFNGGAMQLSTTAHTTLPFVAEIMLTCRAIGNSTNATLMGQGWCVSQCLNISTSDSTSGHSILLMPNVAPVVGNGFDSTITQAVDVFGTFSINNSGNGLTVHQYTLEALN